MNKNDSISKQDLMELGDSILKGVETMIGGVRSEIKDLKNELKTEIRENRRKTKDLDIDTPTQKDFDNLKHKVDTHHPSH